MNRRLNRPQVKTLSAQKRLVTRIGLSPVADRRKIIMAAEGRPDFSAPNDWRRPVAASISDR
jgi:hypothetical protein